MAVQRTDSLDRATDEIFELVWGLERRGVPSAIEYAYEKIWQRLLVLPLNRPQRLSDIALASELEVSRLPVRQALDRLSRDGLIVAHARRGYWTRAYTPHDVREIYDVRRALEVLALERGASHIAQQALTSVSDAITAVRHAIEAGEDQFSSGFLRTDLRLHALIVQASENQRLIQMVSGLRSQMSVFQVQDAGFRERITSALDDHESIVAALLANDTEKAGLLLANHIDRSGAHVISDLFGDQL